MKQGHDSTVVNRASLFGIVTIEFSPKNNDRRPINPFLRDPQWQTKNLPGHGFIAIRQNRFPAAGFYDDANGFTAISGILPDQKNPARKVHEAYQEHGTNFLAFLKGQFVAAGFDYSAKTIWLAIDTLAIRSLYYFEKEGFLYFSDDLQRLILLIDETPEVCPDSLHAYFTLHQIPPPLTGFRKIRCLEPNSILTICEGQIRIKEGIWTIFPEPLRSMQEAAEILESSMEEEIDFFLSQKKSPALLFSGGIDSTLIAVLVRKRTAEIIAYTLGEEGSEELEIARKWAAFLGLKLRQLNFSNVIIDEERIGNGNLPRFSFESFYVGWFCNEVSRQFPVLVTGSGADGIFLSDDILRRLKEQVQRSDHQEGSTLRKALPAARLYSPSKQFARQYLYRPEFRKSLRSSPESVLLKAYEIGSKGGSIAGLLFQYLAFARHSIISSYTDSVDGSGVVFFPYLSRTILNIAAASAEKFPGKILLKQIIKKHLPDFSSHEKKRGFGSSISMDRWFSPTIALRYQKKVLTSPLCDWMLQPEAVTQLFDACARTARDPTQMRLAWGIVSLVRWYDLHFSRKLLQA